MLLGFYLCMCMCGVWRPKATHRRALAPQGRAARFAHAQPDCPSVCWQHCIAWGDAPPLDVWREQTVCLHAVVVVRVSRRTPRWHTLAAAGSLLGRVYCAPPVSSLWGLDIVFVAHNVVVQAVQLLILGTVYFPVPRDCSAP